MCFGKMGVFRGDRAIIQLKMLQKTAYYYLYGIIILVYTRSHVIVYLCFCPVDQYLY